MAKSLKENLPETVMNETWFIYQEHLKNGDQNNFFRLDNPTREDG
jgi:hypothetical protein